MTTTGKPEIYNGSDWLTIGSVQSITAGTGLDGGTIITSGTISLPDIGTAGTYAYPSSIITDEQGRVVTITSGNTPISSVVGTVDQITVTGTATRTVAIVDNPILVGDLTVNGTGFVKIPVGTTAQRPSSPTIGMMRLNTDLV